MQKTKKDLGIDKDALLNQIVNNRYKLVKYLNSGAFAVVFKALDLDASVLEKKDVFVAIKIILKAKNKNIEAIKKRLFLETNTFAKLSFSKNIVKMKDVFSWQNYYVIVMELIDGADLSKKFNAYNNVLSNKEFIYYFLQSTKGLKEIHDNNIIHRDVKPANILIGNDSKVKISDFGISKIKSIILDDSQNHISPGTPRYTAPEQFLNFESRKDAFYFESDIYSIGVIMYEFLTGGMLFLNYNSNTASSKERERANFQQHILKEVVRPREINPNISQALENIIMKCLAKDYKNRYHSFDQIIEDLQKAKQEQNVNLDFPNMWWENESSLNIKNNNTLKYQYFFKNTNSKYFIFWILIVISIFIIFLIALFLK
ncbi:serine/threonine-protein kinase [Mycoplasma capricolum]|uniref:Serine/threonine protein kinase, putative n=1 Tax=Mycoplasma capricolum subsp. capricolum (strain California kid / ATCC 27343 / NCTC 10154) TaxID=340047 RepID=Q2SSL5_MYCCT|nr:serine/threonine-protein kinase [Mycoplasma capricolum]ABC01254.1 serine/threonine protein kinase, putative [Mycoplasma capricolum subsp. capricolum ATCC 27343]